MDIPTVRKFKLAELDAAKYNPRVISDAALTGLRESLNMYGLLEMPVLNVHGGKRVLISGHQRVKALIADGYEFADCVVVDYDDLKEKMANIAMNNPALQGTFDPIKALPSLEYIQKSIPTPNAAGFETLMSQLRAQAEKMGKVEAPANGGAKDDTVKTAGQPKSKVGMTYLLGKNRLFVGDCLTGIPRLLGRKRAAACITDPPYAVDYHDSGGENLANDNLKGEEWQAFVDAFCKLIVDSTLGPCYVFMASKELPALYDGWAKAGGVVQQLLFWSKDRFTLSRGDYHHQYEPCLYGWRGGVTIPAPAKPRTNVLEYPKPKNNELHPTQKPVELIRDLVLDGTEPGAIVIEPFAGSGTTIMVCEEHGRVCYASEMLPTFADRIRKRWAEQVHGAGCDWVKLTRPG